MSVFDIVVPVGPHDFLSIETMLTCTKQNVVGYRNIYIVCSKDFQIENTIHVPETIFPFSIESIDNILHTGERTGWYFQQLIKLYAGSVISGILNNYLVIDADTFFIRPNQFFTQDGKPMYTCGTECHHPYFYHMSKLHPSFRKYHESSGISHHMVFQQHILRELFQLVETYHHNKSPFYKIFLEQVHPNERKRSGASEYEIYFNYLCCYHNNEFVIVEKQWANSSILIYSPDHDFISCHWWL